MKHTKIKVVLVLFCLLLGWNIHDTVQAKESKQKTLSLQSIEITNNGGTVTVPKKDANFVSLIYDTDGQKDGYYSSFVHVKEGTKLNSCYGISYDVTATTDIKMNVNLFDETKDVMQVKEAATLYLIDHKTSIVKRTTVTHGTFFIPSGFSGRVYIPLSVLDGKKEPSVLSSIGFVITLEEEQRAELSLSNIAVIKKDDPLPEGVTESVLLSGDQTVLIPSMGEYHYTYSLGSNSDCYALESETDGVTIKNDGTLVIKETAKPGAVTIVVTRKNKPTLSFDVLLQKPWFLKDDEMKPFFSVQKPAQDRSLKETIISTKYDNLVLIIVGILSIFALIFYKSLIHKNNSNNRGF